MGSFGGHALPGSFFIIVGLYWTVQFYRKLFKSMRKGGTPFYATVTFPCDCCGDYRRRCRRVFNFEVFLDGRPHVDRAAAAVVLASIGRASSR
jgi:hypothetical protein